MKKSKDGKKSRCKECENEYRKMRRRDGKAPAAELRGRIRKDKTRKVTGEDWWWPAFFEALATHGIVTRASEAADIVPQSVYATIKDNETFKLLFEQTRKVGLQRCVDEAIRRGTDGWDEPVFHQGMVVGHKRKYSDKLLEFVIRANFEEYRNVNDTNVNVNGKMSITDAIIAAQRGRKKEEDER